jgi:hypothetical protein
MIERGFHVEQIMLKARRNVSGKKQVLFGCGLNFIGQRVLFDPDAEQQNGYRRDQRKCKGQKIS